MRLKTLIISLSIFLFPFVALAIATPSTNFIPGNKVEELLNLLPSSNKEIEALTEGSRAAYERIKPASSLPDPMLIMSYENLKQQELERMKTTKYGIQQPLILWGKLGIKETIAKGEWRQAKLSINQAKNQLNALIKTDFAIYYQSFHSLEILKEIKDTLSELEKFTKVQYEQGIILQQDLIRVQAELLALNIEINTKENAYKIAKSLINAHLNRDINSTLAEPKYLRTVPKLLLHGNIELLLDKAKRQNPELQIQAQTTSIAKENQKLAKRNWYPDVSIGISGIQRDGKTKGYEAMLETSIPLQIGVKNAKIKEAKAMNAAAKAHFENVQVHLVSSLQEAYLTLQSKIKEEKIITTEFIPKLQLAMDSAIAEYKVNKGTLSSILEACKQLKQLRLNLLETYTDQQNNIAKIEQLIGENL